MWLHRTVIIVCVFIISACGFSPIYKQANTKDSAKLEQINILVSDAIVVDDGSRSVHGNSRLMQQLMQTNLEDTFNSTGKNISSRYDLNVIIRRSKSALAIQKNATITRFKIDITAEFTLNDHITGEQIDKGVLKREGQFDAVQSDYASYISEEKTAKNIIKELAQDFKYTITSILMDLNRI